MSVKMTIQHRGSRGARVLSTEGGGSLVLLPGKTGSGIFDEEYADLLRARAAKNKAELVILEDAREPLDESQILRGGPPETVEDPAEVQAQTTNTPRVRRRRQE